MDKEELEKITVEFMNKYNNIKYARIDSIMGKQLLAYAELFEKRIVELEVTNKKISGECHKLVDSFERMQKENAELKLKLNALEGQTPWKDIKDKSELIGKLTEAKELLKWWVNHCGDHDLFYAEKTEQFLSEVEK